MILPPYKTTVHNAEGQPLDVVSTDMDVTQSVHNDAGDIIGWITKFTITCWTPLEDKNG
jgi:hypothetical protein